MPVPGPSPAQSSLPAAAARSGTHGHGRGADAVTGGKPALPTGPALPFGPAARPSHPVSATAPTTTPAPASLPVPEARPVPGAGPGGDAVAEPVRESAAATATPNPALERIMRGPSGVGTEGLFFTPRQAPPDAPPVRSAAPPAVAPDVPAPRPAAGGRPIPGLYHHPVPEPDPARVEEVSRRIKRWAVDEVEAYPPEWEDQFDGFSVGRYMVACHPDAPTVDHLMIATRLMVAENVVDDCYCEEHGGSPVGLGGRLLLAHTALDPVHTTAEYQSEWAQSLLSDAPRRSYRSAMEYFTRAATPSQADRYRHDMARLHMGYLAEAAWAETEYVPQVAEYLAMRQFNNFRPCPTITDTVGGYELPADLHAMPAMQRVIALAGNATTISNDLYSYTKELDSPGLHLNLPVVIAAREGLSHKEAYLKAVEIHNDLMHAFEAAAAELAVSCPDPRVVRFLRGVAVWVDGNHYWHQSNTYRYSLPDFW
ncbi:family 2 encapsulin nanocompartment cargo protein terpene cyclase [Streptomyces erythrochromogenes]|uniref:family 2 encapsulin nanocompartment cargo protein terpene cyclase n=1 Tax=Streptomyces erythrochromogenes TaxID=285574 RepID=UPI00386384CB|nr:family 2 encapsulin nanocompartment cargo protein terpene cyclase [Streptomyces erythrochromogenes]